MALVSKRALLEKAQLPTLPPIYSQLVAAINNPQGSVSAISEVISSDPALSARLLHIANSAMFQFRGQVSTISAAVRLVGTQQIRDLSLATLLMTLFDGINPVLVSMESFWRHSLACGIAARALAAHRREANVEKFFVAGLLHDLGKLVLYMNPPDQELLMLLQDPARVLPMYLIERRRMGFDHAELGAALLGAWELPAVLQEAVARHHAPDGARDYPVVAATVHVADIIANSMELGSSGEHMLPPLAQHAWTRIGLPIILLETILQQVENQFDATAELLGPP